MEKLMNKDLSEKDFLVEVFEAADLKKQNEQLRKMFDMQVKLIVALQLENEKLRNTINSLTKNEISTI
jgi:regulator of replication initiation timing